MRLYYILLIGLLLSLPVSGQTGFNIMRTSGEANHGIFFARYSPDGNFIVTTGSDLNVIVWNAETGNIFRTLSGSLKTPRVAAFSPSGDKVASGGDGNAVSLWDIKTASIISTFELKQGAVRAVDISTDGTLLAAAGTDRSVRIWDIESKKLLFDLKSHKDEVNVLKFNPDGKLLASGGADKTLIIWNAGDGTIIKSKESSGTIRDVAFSQDGSFIISCGDDSIIQVSSVPDLNLIKTISCQQAGIRSIALSRDGRYLITGSSNGIISLWNFQTGEILSSSDKLDQTVASVSFRPGKTDFISAGLGSENFYTWTLTEAVTTAPSEKTFIPEKDFMMEKRAEEQMPPPVMVYEKAAPGRAARKETEVSKAETVSRTSDYAESFVEKPDAVYKSPDVPLIDLYYPSVSSGSSTTGLNNTYIIGRISNAEGTNVILINKKPVKLSEAGVFEYKIDLTKGVNPVNIIAVNKKGKMKDLSVSIECTAETATSGNQGSATEGKYYALIIGINDYISSDISDLDNPVKDAQKLSETLLNLYTFNREDITTLKNPTLSEIITSLDGLVSKLTPKDNLLIFYAGHGYWDEKGKVGYWFPSDATKGSTVNWFRNSTLRDFIGSIPSKHILLIADACFSGAILKTRDAFAEAPQGVQKLYDLPSRKAMTSGNESQAVSDESTFMRYLIERLAENPEKFLPSETLFSSFKAAVMNNSSNMPQYGVIQNVGDEGGEFVFIKR
jgi:WD40 repeat protein